MSQLPDMDAAAKAEYFLDIHNLLLVKPRYTNQAAQTPKNWEPLVFDGMNCFRIDPWEKVLAVQGINLSFFPSSSCYYSWDKDT